MSFKYFRLLSILLVVFLAPARGASPFADKPCLSYSSLAGPDGKPLEIPWGEVKADDFGPVPITFDQTGVRTIRPAPPAGVHPRILFGPDDLPDIRARLKNTFCGQMMWKKILSWSHALHGDYDEKADYAQPDLIKGDFRGSHGHIQFLYYHDKDNPFNPANHLWDRLVSGDLTADPKPFWPIYSFDAYRCLIDNDAVGAKALAAAVLTSLKTRSGRARCGTGRERSDRADRSSRQRRCGRSRTRLHLRLSLQLSHP